MLRVTATGLPAVPHAEPATVRTGSLGISTHTVKFHVASILAKLDAGSRTEAVTRAARRGDLIL